MHTKEFIIERDVLYKLFDEKIKNTFDLKKPNISYKSNKDGTITLTIIEAELNVWFGRSKVQIIINYNNDEEETIILEYEGQQWLVTEDSDCDKSVFDEKHLDKLLGQFNMKSKLGRA